MNTFHSVKVFSVTMYRDREALGDQVTQWLEEAPRQWPGFQLVDIVIRQSSDEAFHCLSICIFFKYNVAPPKKEARRG